MLFRRLVDGLATIAFRIGSRRLWLTSCISSLQSTLSSCCASGCGFNLFIVSIFNNNLCQLINAMFYRLLFLKGVHNASRHHIDVLIVFVGAGATGGMFSGAIVKSMLLTRHLAVFPFIARMRCMSALSFSICCVTRSFAMRGVCLLTPGVRH